MEKLLDFELITNVEIEGIDSHDAPDFCDAYIANCWYDGKPATDEQIEEINDDQDFVYQEVLNWIY